MYVRDQVKSDLKYAIIAELKRLGIDPEDRTGVMMHSQEIWRALVQSGRMPKILNFDNFMDGMFSASEIKKE